MYVMLLEAAHKNLNKGRGMWKNLMPGGLVDNRKCCVTVSEWVKEIKHPTRGYLRPEDWGCECRLLTLVSIGACRRQLAPAPIADGDKLWQLRSAETRAGREQLLAPAPRRPWRGLVLPGWRLLPCQSVIASVTERTSASSSSCHPSDPVSPSLTSPRLACLD